MQHKHQLLAKINKIQLSKFRLLQELQSNKLKNLSCCHPKSRSSALARHDAPRMFQKKKTKTII